MYYLFWSKASKFNIYNRNSKENSVYCHSSQRNCENSKMDEEDEHSSSQVYYPEELETFEHHLLLLVLNWDMIKSHCTWSASASYQRSLPQPALNSSELHLDYIPPLLFSSQYLYTRFHIVCLSLGAKIFQLWGRHEGLVLGIFFILLHGKFLQFDWFRVVVFQLNLKYLHVKMTNLLRVVV